MIAASTTTPRRISPCTNLPVAAILATAAVVLIVLGLNLEFRIQGHQLVVRWGNPPQVEPTPVAPNLAVPQANLVHSETPVSPAIHERLQLLNDLIHALAADVEARDRNQRDILNHFQKRLDNLQSESQQRWTSAERDLIALYTAQFAPPKKAAWGRGP